MYTFDFFLVLLLEGILPRICQALACSSPVPRFREPISHDARAPVTSETLFLLLGLEIRTVAT